MSRLHKGRAPVEFSERKSKYPRFRAKTRSYLAVAIEQTRRENCRGRPRRPAPSAPQTGWTPPVSSCALPYVLSRCQPTDATASTAALAWLTDVPESVRAD